MFQAAELEVLQKQIRGSRISTKRTQVLLYNASWPKILVWRFLEIWSFAQEKHGRHLSFYVLRYKVKLSTKTMLGQMQNSRSVVAAWSFGLSMKLCWSNGDWFPSIQHWSTWENSSGYIVLTLQAALHNLGNILRYKQQANDLVASPQAYWDRLNLSWRRWWILWSRLREVSEKNSVG